VLFIILAFEKLEKDRQRLQGIDDARSVVNIPINSVTSFFIIPRFRLHKLKVVNSP